MSGLTVERLREVMRYDAETGALYWLKPSSFRVCAGARVGGIAGGVRATSVDGFKISTARATWAIVHGEFTSSKLVHINGDCLDERIENLRESGAYVGVALTQKRLQEVMDYDPVSGEFVRVVSASSNAQAGSKSFPSSRGYKFANVDGRLYPMHRLAWLYMTGAWPTGRIDHVDGNGENNRFANLRDATPAINSQNQRVPHRCNKSGYLGVSLCPRSKRWKAQITVGNRNRFLGRFDTPATAHEAYLTAKRQLHEGCTI